jgi:hypothetical protein
MNLLDFTEIPAEGERWSHFGREFLQVLGFHTETPSYRDAENIFDFTAIEQLPGKFNLQPFRWLVSCRHKAATRTAVKESEEAGILERLLRSRADGFLGIYSTQASSALEYYLSELKSQSQIKDYRILDAKFLESYLATPAFFRLTSRWFPSYAQTHPVLHLVENEYLPILCEHCKKDLLKSLFTEDQQGVVVRLRRRKKSAKEKESAETTEIIANLYYACKGNCDIELQTKYCNDKLLDAAGWVAISDVAEPSGFLDRLTLLLSQIGTDEITYTTQALEKEIYLLKALAQYTLRESAANETQQIQKINFL